MSDLDLLKMAAKAAGVSVEGWTMHPARGMRYVDENHNFVRYWNPLTDDGDALRLAVDLRLQIKPGKHKGDGCTVESQRDGIAGCTAFYDDKAQQMRYSIVHVAAEIGKAMP